MNKVIHVSDSYGESYVFICPGCGMNHSIPTVYFSEDRQFRKPAWKFYGNLERPTFHPSINYEWRAGENLLKRCHFYIREGKIQFLEGCTHEFANVTVEMENAE